MDPVPLAPHPDGVWRPSKRPPPPRFFRRMTLRARDALRALTPRRSVLTIVHAGGGGAILTNEDLMRALSPRCDCFILACGPNKWVLSKVDGAATRLEEVKFAEDWRGGAPMSVDREAALEALLTRYRFDVVHVRSVLGSGPEAIEAARAAGSAVVVSFHDFTAVCPTIQLLDADLVHCAGVCTPSLADCTPPQKWFADIERLKHAYVHEWRARFARALPAAQAFVTTSRSAADLLERFYPQLENRIRIVEHGRRLKRAMCAAPPTRDAPVRVVILGTIGAAKGRGLLETLIRRNAESGAKFEFHLLGEFAPSGGSEHPPGLITHGSYLRDDLHARLAEISPSLSLIAPLWPETFSHTLTESFAAGIPVLASDIGALGERIRKEGGGWLLPPHDSEAWFLCMRGITEDPNAWAAKAAEIKRMRLRRVAPMADAYYGIYRTAYTLTANLP